MKLYIVRHGLSELGEDYHQLPETPLSSVGFEQVKTLANRFKSIPIDLLISSSYKRALQTAEEIKKIKSVSITISELFIERVMPSSFLGKSVKDSSIISIHQTIRDHFYEADWHYSNEENFIDLFNRAKTALEFIQSQNKEIIVAITHGYFLAVLTFLILLGKDASTSGFKSFRKHTKNSNTGITVFEYENNEWRLVTWNDITHLGD